MCTVESVKVYLCLLLFNTVYVIMIHGIIFAAPGQVGSIFLILGDLLVINTSLLVF